MRVEEWLLLGEGHNGLWCLVYWSIRMCVVNPTASLVFVPLLFILPPHSPHPMHT